MATYLSEEQASADDFTIEHETEKHRFALMKDGRVIGEARYRLIGSSDNTGTETDAAGDPGAAIDFKGTFVDPEFRGTGLSTLLAQRAVTDEVTRGRRKLASCWFIEEYFERHPELRTG